MTEEQKDILIAKMLDSPTSLTDEEVGMLNEDEELRDIYELSSEISGAYANQREINAAEEWELFRPRIRQKPTSMRWVVRVAAIFLGVVLVSGIAVRLIDNILIPQNQEAIAKVEKVSVAKYVTENKTDTAVSKTEEEVADNSPVCRNHQPALRQSVAIRSVNKYDNRKEQTQPEIDVDEYLRLQQARIDNELAMQAAETYLDEISNLEEMLAAEGVVNPEMNASIMKVTMQ